MYLICCSPPVHQQSIVHGVALPLQTMLEHWFYRWNLRYMLKGDEAISTYGTSDMQLLESVKEVAAATAYGKDPYPKWTPIKLMQEDKLPAFGLRVVPKAMLPGAADGLGA